MANGTEVVRSPIRSGAVVLCGAGAFVLAPRSVRLSDVNPVTGVEYAHSRYTDLPPWVADVVTDELKLRPREWDARVASGVGVDRERVFSLARMVGAVLTRPAAVVAGLCGDCAGTGLVGDPEGERTGVAGVVYVCPCLGIRVQVPGVTVVPPSGPDGSGGEQDGERPVTATVIERCRVERGWSKAETARRLADARRARGLGAPTAEPMKRTYLDWEAGVRRPVEWLPEFCAVFGLTPAEFGFADAMRRRSFTVGWDVAAFAAQVPAPRAELAGVA